MTAELSVHAHELSALAGRSLLFVHLPKTGGTSVADLLGTRFNPQETLSLRSITPAAADEGLLIPDRHRFIHGHVAFDVVQRFRTRPFVLTILRDPVERAVSAFYFLRQTAVSAEMPSETALRRAAARHATQVSLGEFAATEVGRQHLGNRQVMLLAQPHTPDFFVRRGTHQHVPTEADLERALENLAACDVVGITEQLQTTVDVLSHALGGPHLGTVGTANATLGRPALKDVDAETLEVVSEHCAFDLVLYRAACERFERDRAAMSSTVALPRSPMATGLASEVRFDGVIPGGGWCTPERSADGWYGWSGPGPTAWIDVATPSVAEAVLEIEVVHTILIDPLAGLQLRVNGTEVEWEATPRDGGGELLRTQVPGRLLAPTGHGNRVEVTVRGTARPCDVWPTNPDSRSLGIAIGRVALVSAG